MMPSSAIAMRTVGLLTLLVLTTACAACSGLKLRPTPPTQVQPVFASDDEAVAAAVETYERYLAVSAEIDADGGAGAERVLEVTTEPYGLDVLAEYRRMRAARERISGAAMLTSSRLVEIDRDRTRLTIAMCVDVSGMRVINESGEDVTPPREDRVALEVAFRSANAVRVRLDGSVLATGDHVC